MDEYVEDEGAPGEEDVEEVEQITDGGKEEQGRNVYHTAQVSTDEVDIFSFIKFLTFPFYLLGVGVSFKDCNYS